MIQTFWWIPGFFALIDFMSTWWIVEVKGGVEHWIAKYCFRIQQKIFRFGCFCVIRLGTAALYLGYAFYWGVSDVIIVLAIIVTFIPAANNLFQVYKIMKNEK